MGGVTRYFFPCVCDNSTIWYCSKHCLLLAVFVLSYSDGWSVIGLKNYLIKASVYICYHWVSNIVTYTLEFLSQVFILLLTEFNVFIILNAVYFLMKQFLLIRLEQCSERKRSILIAAWFILLFQFSWPFQLLN